MEKVLCEGYGKIHETFWFLFDHFAPMAKLVNFGTQNEQTDAHGSNGTTQVAIGYQQIAPSLTDPHLSPLRFPQTHILPGTQMRQIDLRKLKSSRVRAFCRVARPPSTSTS